MAGARSRSAIRMRRPAGSSEIVGALLTALAIG